MESAGSNPQALDAKWYERFAPLTSFLFLGPLMGKDEHRAEQKTKFLSGELENPTLDYSNVDLADIDRRERELLNLKKEIIADPETQEIVKQVYRWRINESIAELRMLRAAAKGETRRFQLYNNFVFGKPSPEIFAYSLNEMHANLDAYLTSENPEVQKVARELLKLLPQKMPQNTVQPISLPDAETVTQAQSVTREQLGSIINIPVQGGKFDIEGIRRVFTYALEKLGAEGWTTVPDTSGKSWMSTEQPTKEVRIPKTFQLTAQRLEQLLLHEVGTHVVRRLRGERSKLMLLGLGLDRHEKGEEGLGVMREQIVKGKVEEFAHLERHLAISLAVGLDEKPRNFREVFEIMYRHYLLPELAKGKKDRAEINESAKNKAWNLCLRIFRGTPCSERGICFTKDMVYREGNIGMWDVIREKPDEMMRFNVGKYDPANPRHLWVLDQLGITDEDLTNLE